MIKKMKGRLVPSERWCLIRRRSVSVLRHITCVLALMWTGIVNGQPFFFPDSTNYIRAADLAVYIASGRTLSTVWTERYRTVLTPTDGTAPVPRGEAIHRTTANDLRAGLVMSGRSPYIGALMYAGWVLGWFWPFVLFQASVAYLLIRWTLRRFALDQPLIVLATCLGISATTSLPTYNSLLLADGFASFGILAFILLALPGRLTRWQVTILVAVLITATTAHLTHLIMLLAMTAALGLFAAVGLPPPARRIWIAAPATMFLALVALQATELATRVAIGHSPQLLPLITARFYMDGPGRAFIDSGCEGRRFEVCRIPIGRPVNNAGWLFDTNPAVGAYMAATPEQRRLMGEQDAPPAHAASRAYPRQQMAASASNTVRQLVWIDYDGLNQGCASQGECWPSLPPSVRQRFERSLSGQNAWPQSFMNTVLYMTVIGALAVLIVSTVLLSQLDQTTFLEFCGALLLLVIAMLACSFVGGAVADPQYRYQGRLIWLPVFFAVIAALRVYRSRDGRWPHLPLGYKFGSRRSLHH